MQLGYGTYLFPFNAALIDDRRQQLWNEGGQLYAYRRRLTCEGFLQVAVTGSTGNQAGVTLAMSAMMQALSRPFQDLVLYMDGGGTSSTQLRNAGSITGVRVVEGPSFPNKPQQPSYVWGIFFTFAAEAEYPYPNTGDFLLDFGETLNFRGGYPKNVCRPALNTNGQDQLVYPQMPFLLDQTGFAVGYQGWPDALAISPPKFPANLVGDNPIDVQQVNPKAMNVAQGKYQGYRVTWRYSMGSTQVPLRGVVPSRWV